MILAKCPNADCIEHGNEYLIDADATRVECGACGYDCDLADADEGFPPPPEPPAEIPDPYAADYVEATEE